MPAFVHACYFSVIPNSASLHFPKYPDLEAQL